MPHRDSIGAQALQSVPFFANLSEDDAAELATLLTARRFGADQVIFHLGDPGGLLYIIVRGKVKISHTTPEGQEALLAILGPRTFFGELALLDDSPRSATAIAMEPTETLTLHREDFIRYLNANPGFALQVLQTLARHIRRMNSQLADVFFLDLPGRLARTLLSLAAEYGRQTEDGLYIDLVLTQTNLAEMTGATRVSVNKALGRFRRQNWISISGRHVTIHDKEALQELISASHIA